MNPKLTAILVVLIVIFILLINSAYRVFETEQIQITKFGAPIKTVTEPGLNFKIPFIEKLHVFEKRLLDYDSAPTEILTQDKKTLIVDNYAKWRITDPLKFMKTVKNIPGAQTRLDDIIYSEVRTELGKHLFHQIISGQRSEIMEKVTRSSNDKAQEYGIEVVDVRIKRADLPPENERAVYERMDAEPPDR